MILLPQNILSSFFFFNQLKWIRSEVSVWGLVIRNEHWTELIHLLLDIL